MEESFNERVRLFTNKSSQCFSVFHVNLRGVNANLCHLEHYLQMLNFKFPVIGITETWLDNNILICLLYQRIHLLSAIGRLKVVEELDFYKGWYKVSRKVRFGNFHRSLWITIYWNW